MLWHLQFIVEASTIYCRCLVWQSFKSGHTKLERFLPKKQHTKLLNFYNWCSGELSKIGHHFSDKVI